MYWSGFFWLQVTPNSNYSELICTCKYSQKILLTYMTEKKAWIKWGQQGSILSPSPGSAFLSWLYSQAGSCHVVVAERVARSPRYTALSLPLIMPKKKEFHFLVTSFIGLAQTRPFFKPITPTRKEAMIWFMPNPETRTWDQLSPIIWIKTQRGVIDPNWPLIRQLRNLPPQKKTR